MKQAIIFFTRVPVKGKVKTRLAQSIGDEEALFLAEGIYPKNHQ